MLLGDIMRYKQLDISQIQYTQKDYSKALYDSIIRIGFSFPIQVIYQDEQYQCVDGHKRLSALADILKNISNYQRGSQVYVLVKNSDAMRSSDCWRGRNTH